MKQVIVFPRGQLTDADRARMEEVGIIAVEADDPSAVVTVIPGAPLASSDDLAVAALKAVVESASSSTSTIFAKELRNRIAAREAQGKQR